MLKTIYHQKTTSHKITTTNHSHTFANNVKSLRLLPLALSTAVCAMTMHVHQAKAIISSSSNISSSSSIETQQASVMSISGISNPNESNTFTANLAKKTYTKEDYERAIDFLINSEDAMQSLIAFKEQYYTTTSNINNTQPASSNRPQSTTKFHTGKMYQPHMHDHSHNHSHYSFGVSINTPNFEQWLNSSPYNQKRVKTYRDYLSKHLGTSNVPPMDQLLTTARSWSKCDASPYAVPPESLWENMVPTLRLYAKLKNSGTLPYDAKIRSVYRNPELNACADGAHDSKHKLNAAIDIWVPRFEGSAKKINKMKEDLCTFWLYKGQPYNFGLGLYGTGAIHLDTQGYRKWGKEYSPSSSLCQLDF